MKFPLPKIDLLLNRFSPDVAEHFRCLMAEIKVGRVHSRGAKKCLREFKDARHLKVNSGSGNAPKPGFLNLDFSPAADVRLNL